MSRVSCLQRGTGLLRPRASFRPRRGEKCDAKRGKEGFADGNPGLELQQVRMSPCDLLTPAALGSAPQLLLSSLPTHPLELPRCFSKQPILPGEIIQDACAGGGVQPKVKLFQAPKTKEEEKFSGNSVFPFARPAPQQRKPTHLPPNPAHSAGLAHGWAISRHGHFTAVWSDTSPPDEAGPALPCIRALPPQHHAGPVTVSRRHR